MSTSVLALVRADPALTPADLGSVQALNLEGYLHAHLPPGHPLRTHLRGETLQRSVRHQLIARELRDLLRVWHAEGIPAVLTKGFALAEFEYRSPTERYYGDVDLLLPEDPATVARAVHLALAHGWRSDGQHAHPDAWTHESAHLWSPGGHARLDVHRFVIAWTAGDQRRTRELTRQVWNRSVPQDWQGVTVRRAAPLDQAVVTLMLARTWGGDAGGLKPADYTDLDQLRRRYGLTEENLIVHARSLGGEHTARAFLAACSPWRSVFRLDDPGLARGLHQGAVQDGMLTTLDAWRSRLRDLPRRLRLMPRVWPQVRAGLQAARQAPGTPVPVPRPSRSARLSHAERLDLVSAGQWLMRLSHPGVAREALGRERAHVSFQILRAAGEAVELVWGCHPVTGELQVWIEDDRGVPDWYGDPRVRQTHPEMQRWPARE